MTRPHRDGRDMNQRVRELVKLDPHPFHERSTEGLVALRVVTRERDELAAGIGLTELRERMAARLRNDRFALEPSWPGGVELQGEARRHDITYRRAWNAAMEHAAKLVRGELP